MCDDVSPLLSSDRIRQRVRELGVEITRDYAGRSLTLVVVLKGGFVFAADLARAIDLPVRIEFLGVRSYGDHTKSSGVVEITQDLTAPVDGHDLLIVEDIVDSGLTSRFLLDVLATRKPRSLRLCALLHKPARMQQQVPIDYLGFTIDDVFVVGYGLDWQQRYRSLPFVGTIPDPER
jgi:hypoxanthine phosphoribosyltransferase